MSVPEIVLKTRQAASGQSGENAEVRQVTTTDDMHPDPSKSIKLPPNRQKLVDDVIALYSMEPTVERVSRYAPSCVYDDQFVYANNRYKMACQWYALPKLFAASRNEGYEIVHNSQNLIQFKNEQTWELLGLGSLKPITINALVSLSLDPATSDSDFPLITYHKDQAVNAESRFEGSMFQVANHETLACLTQIAQNEKDYSHGGIGFILKKGQADIVPSLFLDDSSPVHFFKEDDLPDKPVREHGSGTNAPTKDF